MKSSYLDRDVTLLLKDISGLVTPLPTKEREQLIQSGVHYCEMLPLEYKPTQKYMEAYHFALNAYAQTTADAVCQAAEKIYASIQEDFRQESQNFSEVVLVSLARAGIPIGILIKRYLEHKYNISVFHYSISIIRDRGIDENAIHYILDRHQTKSVRFVDGWIGKGAIQRELKQALKPYPELNPTLAVLSDPANITDLCGTHEDILIPSSCLNSTVSGLISRTFLRSDIIGKDDFHGAVFYSELKEEDLSYEFIDAIERHFDYDTKLVDTTPSGITGLSEVENIAKHFHIDNINFIKPGIGEATRVLIRRVPWKLLVCPGAKQNPLLAHLLQLAKEKDVPVEEYPLQNYIACGIIKNVADA